MGYGVCTGGFDKVPQDQAPVKEKFFLRGKTFYKAKSSDWKLQGPPMTF
jgi:hypothetical protein